MIQFRGLGDFQLRVEQAIVPLGSPRQRTLLATLLACANELVPVTSLIEELWPDREPRHALANLRTYASGLRRLLPLPVAARIVTRNGGYQLTVQPGEFDLWKLREQYATARAALEAADPSAAIAALEPLQPALATGDAFAGVPAGPILTAVRARVDEECRNARDVYFEACIRVGRHLDVIGELRSHIRRTPLAEQGYALLMSALRQAGDNSAALQVYRRARQLLVDEIGVEPGVELRRLQQEILRGEPISPGGAIRLGDAIPRVDSVESSELGSPAPIVARQTVVFRPFQLPADLPDFSGRRDAVKELIKLLSNGSSGAWPAVASITGMPGTGKSTLAVHVAHLLRGDFPDGQIYLDLGGDDLGTVDTHDALGQVLSALGFAAAAMPATADERAAVFRSICADRQLLVVFDNASSAEQVLPLFPASPSCGVLVTSRAVLAGLQPWPHVELAPLDRDDGVEMLTRIVGGDRTQTDPDAADRVVDLCAGLPLAIRIAGTRLASRAHQSLRWLARRLDDERTRLDELAVTGVALRRSFDLAYHGLDSEHRHALRVLGMLDMSEFGAWVAAAALQHPLREAEDYIDGLVGARLITVAAGRALDVPRYRFHQLVRLYVRDVASAAESAHVMDSAVSRAYQVCLAAAADMDQRLRRHTPVVTSDRGRLPDDPEFDRITAESWFATEYPTLVATVHGAAAHGWHDLAWDLALTLQRFLESHHHLHDWQAVAKTGLSSAQESGDRVAEAAMWCSLGEAHAVADDQPSAAAAFDAARELAATLGADRVQARALLGLSNVYAAAGRVHESTVAVTTMIELVDAAVDQGAAAEAWMRLGANQHQQKDFAAAGASFAHAHDGFVATGDRMNQAILLVNMGTTNGAADQAEAARRCFEESARICQEIGFRSGEGFAYTALGVMLRRRGDDVPAEHALLAALAIVREYADAFTESMITTHLGELYRSRDLHRSRQQFCRAVELLADKQMPVMLADALAGLGETELTAGDAVAARVAWTQAADLLAPVDAVRAAALRDRIAAL